MSEAEQLVPGIALLFGLLIGSFLNVAVHRIPRQESLVHPRSRCPHCKKQIAARDNIPVLSWLLLRGRCRHCGAGISLRYPLVELGTGMIFALVAAVYGATLLTPLYCAFGALLIAAALIDYSEHWIPDRISLGGLLFGLLAAPAAVHLSVGDAWQDAALRSLYGALLGGGSFWAFGFLHARLCDALGRRFEHWPGEVQLRPGRLDYWTWFPGLGFGDVKLLAMVGAFLGPAGALWTLLLSAVFGVLFGLPVALAKNDIKQPFGFAPAISLGALVVVLLPQFVQMHRLIH